MENFDCNPKAATNGIGFILPGYNAFPYSRRAALSFFKYTPEDLNPVCIYVDDASPLYAQQNWDYWYEGLPRDRCVHRSKPTNLGLTESWNWGLQKARELGCRYAIAGNSDVLLTEGWYEGLCWHLDRKAHLVGPVTNAPGWSNNNSQRQNICKYYPEYQVMDDSDYLTVVARYIKEHRKIEEFHEVDINGFFTMSTIEKWWAGAYTQQNVFDPKYKMTGNEDELQRRWRKKKWKIGFVPSSFVFHYRAVSRGDKRKHQGWARLDNMHKSV